MSRLELPFLQSLHAPISSEAPALCDDQGEWLNYQNTRQRITALSSFFKTSSRALVFGCLPNTVEGALVYLSAAASGHGIALADPDMPHLSAVIESYQPEWLVTASSHTYINYVDTKWDLPNLRLLRRVTSSDVELHPDFYLLLLTSGSTGSGKGVRLSYKNIHSNTKAILKSLGIGKDVRALLHLPLFYSFGLSILHTQLAIGGSCILTKHGMMNKEFWQLAHSQKANLFPGVPYHFEMLEKLGLERLDSPDLKIFLQAGGKMSDEKTKNHWKKIEQRQGQLFVMYGQTEASPRIASLAVHHHPNKIGSCGTILDEGFVTIKDEEIIYAGPNVMMGYAESRADLAQDDLMKGHLATGDIGSLDAEGFLTITGRKQRFAKLYGQRIALDDLERIASLVLPTIALEGETQIILATTDPNQELHTHLKTILTQETGLPPTWLDVRHIKSIPHTSQGKVDYTKLRSML
ncbi:MAG: AMP-binding protein [Alphaproteobacteria bacterium]